MTKWLNAVLSIDALTSATPLGAHNGEQKHEIFVDFENPCSRAKPHIIITSHNYVHFCTCYC